MEFGVFLPIANNGWIISKASPQYMPTFELNRHVTMKAEEVGFDFALSMVKYRGYGGETEHWDYALDSLSLMAGLASVTDRIRLYGTIQPLTLHPAMAARMAMTIDDISGGRFGINVITGWNKYEYAQMGLWPGDAYYNQRYDYAEEWLNVVKMLWKDGRVTYKGEHYHLDDCLCLPTPRQQPSLPIVCAGMSDRGLRFTVEHADISFVAADFAGCKALSQKTKQMAQAMAKLYADHADFGAFKGVVEASGNDPSGSTAKMMNKENAFITPTIIGAYETVSDYLLALETDTDVDGVLVTFPDFLTDVETFGRIVIPAVRKSALDVLSS
ncbi:pyrimidine monooxygenase RutA [Alicyclobacillus acidoterrestris]|nr:pyrimidine monooxygenase RutA [Alicyclobacillus acidoterrestris]